LFFDRRPGQASGLHFSFERGMIRGVAFQEEAGRGASMPATVVLGCQWGDEGKGKIVDLLSEHTDWVARYSGGPNAGHTVDLSGEIFVLHLIPSGILWPRVRCVIGNGVVVDLDHLVEEIASLEKRGIGVADRLYISGAAHLLLPYHRWIEELHRQDVRVGTTRRGIGPAYQDKMGRNGIRLHELLDRGRLRDRLDEELGRVEVLHHAYGRSMPQSRREARDRWSRRYAAIAEALGPAITDTVDLLQTALARGERVLCEGSQGTFLDIDHGSYPFVTSASTTAGGAATGLGIAPNQIEKVIGIAKAYTTRVGNGFFPTEFPAKFADSFRQKAGEFGATTGRPRRCGWLDAVLLRQSVRLNGIEELYVTKLDVLSGLKRLRIGVAYRHGKRRLECPPLDPQIWAECQPVYVGAPGWSQKISSVRTWAGLPASVRDYVREIEKLAGCQVRLVSVGAARGAAFPVSRSRTRSGGIAAGRRSL
jgi:adenylosuccinate synthase